MSDDMQRAPKYQAGQVINGFVYTGTEWVPLKQPAPAPRQNPLWLTIGGIIALVICSVAGIQGLAWLSEWFALEQRGNPFSGVLLVLGLGAMTVAAAFGFVGLFIFTRK